MRPIRLGVAHAGPNPRGGGPPPDGGGDRCHRQGGPGARGDDGHRPGTPRRDSGPRRPRIPRTKTEEAIRLFERLCTGCRTSWIDLAARKRLREAPPDGSGAIAEDTLIRGTSPGIGAELAVRRQRSTVTNPPPSGSRRGAGVGSLRREVPVRFTGGRRAPLRPASKPCPPRTERFATGTPIGLPPAGHDGARFLHACRKDTVGLPSHPPCLRSHLRRSI